MQDEGGGAWSRRTSNDVYGSEYECGTFLICQTSQGRVRECNIVWDSRARASSCRVLLEEGRRGVVMLNGNAHDEIPHSVPMSNLGSRTRKAKRQVSRQRTTWMCVDVRAVVNGAASWTQNRAAWPLEE